VLKEVIDMFEQLRCWLKTRHKYEYRSTIVLREYGCKLDYHACKLCGKVREVIKK